MSNKTENALDHLEFCVLGYREAADKNPDGREASTRYSEWMAAREYFFELNEKINTWRLIAAGLFLALLLS